MALNAKRAFKRGDGMSTRGENKRRQLPALF